MMTDSYCATYKTFDKTTPEVGDPIVMWDCDEGSSQEWILN